MGPRGSRAWRGSAVDLALDRPDQSDNLLMKWRFSGGVATGKLVQFDKQILEWLHAQPISAQAGGYN
jgi:hypothetical protein